MTVSEKAQSIRDLLEFLTKLKAKLSWRKTDNDMLLQKTHISRQRPHRQATLVIGHSTLIRLTSATLQTIALILFFTRLSSLRLSNVSV